MAHNPHAKVTHHYSVLDDLAQSLAAMSTLEVIQTCPSQKKALLTILGAIDPLESHMMTFYIVQSAPQFPSSMTFQIPITIKNICIYHCVINEGALTYIISTKIWKDLGSPTLVPSTITLREYDGRPSKSQGLYQNVLISLVGKKTLIDAKVFDAQLDYNIFLG